MTNLLDHIPRTPLLDGIDDWPKSATRKEWFEITRRLVQTTIDEMDLDPAAMSEVEEAFIGVDCCDALSCDSRFRRNSPLQKREQ